MRSLKRFLIISLVIAGATCVFAFKTKRDLELANGNAAEWTVVIPLALIFFLSVLSLVLVVYALARVAPACALYLQRPGKRDQIFERVAKDLELEFEPGVNPGLAGMKGTFNGVSISISNLKPEERTSNYDEKSAYRTSPYTVCTLTMPGGICDARLCTHDSASDYEYTISEGELDIKLQRVREITRRFPKLKITQTLITWSLIDFVLPVICSERKLRSTIISLHALAELLSSRGSSNKPAGNVAAARPGPV